MISSYPSLFHRADQNGYIYLWAVFLMEEPCGTHKQCFNILTHSHLIVTHLHQFDAAHSKCHL